MLHAGQATSGNRRNQRRRSGADVQTCTIAPGNRWRALPGAGFPVYAYDPDFYNCAYLTSGPSAAAAVPVISGMLGVRSILDVGCGQGAWLREWMNAGVTTVAGIDGPYIDPGMLLFPAACFQAVDLRQRFALGETFDLVVCLEVGEHLPAVNAADLVASLCAHGDMVLFSAAPPGQGGEHHVNEQPYSYWKTQFEANGFVLFDCIRPALATVPQVSRWYRQNSFLYAAQSRAASLPPGIRNTLVPPGADPPDLSSGWYRLRKGVIRLLPTAAVTMLSIMKKRTVRFRRRFSRVPMTAR
jgi:SAM-dependent methyltransferase